MVKEHKRLWAHYEKVKELIIIYFVLFFIVLFLAICFSLLTHQTEIDGGKQGAVTDAILIGLKWYAIIMPIITVLFAVGFLVCSDYVKFTEKSLKYYRWIFSKQSRNIPFDDITDCVVLAKIWKNKRDNETRRRITLFNKNQIVLQLDIYYKLALKLFLSLDDKRFRLVGEKGNLNTVSKYYNIDFENLNQEEQLKLLKDYCRFNKRKYKTGEEILQKN